MWPEAELWVGVLRGQGCDPVAADELRMSLVPPQTPMMSVVGSEHSAFVLLPGAGVNSWLISVCNQS